MSADANNTGSSAWAKKSFRELHRSVRFADISRVSVVLSLAAALILSIGFLRFESQIVSLHQQIVHAILVRSGIPAARFTASAYSGGFEVPYPAVRFLTYSNQPAVPIVIAGITTVLLLAVYFWVRLSRMLVILLLALLGASLVNLWLGGTFGTEPGSFTTIWLRYEFVTWVTVPWLMAVFAGIVMPAGWPPLFWIVMPAAYAVVWSAARLALCIGVLRFTGPLLAPVLWFAIGALADMLYIAVFYSFVAVHGSRLRRSEAD